MSVPSGLDAGVAAEQTAASGSKAKRDKVSTTNQRRCIIASPFKHFLCRLLWLLESHVLKGWEGTTHPPAHLSIHVVSKRTLWPCKFS